MSLLLKGPGYVEHQPDGSKKQFMSLLNLLIWRLHEFYEGHGIVAYPLRDCEWINARLDAAKPHRVELDEAAGPQWTLIFCGKHLRNWGFHVEQEKAKRVKVTGGRSAYVNDAYWVDHKSFHELASASAD